MLLIIESVYYLFYWELSSGNVTSPLDWHGTGQACELDPTRSKKANTNQQLSIPEIGALPKKGGGKNERTLSTWSRRNCSSWILGSASGTSKSSCTNTVSPFTGSQCEVYCSHTGQIEKFIMLNTIWIYKMVLWIKNGINTWKLGRKHTLPSRNHQCSIIQQILFHILWQGKYNTGRNGKISVIPHYYLL